MESFLLQRILINLEIGEIIKLPNVSKIFYNLLQNDDFWYEYFKKRGRNLKYKPKLKIQSYYDNYLFFDKIQNYLDMVNNFPNLKEELELCVELDEKELNGIHGTHDSLCFENIFRGVDLGSRKEQIKRLWDDFMNLFEIYHSKIKNLLSGQDFEFVYIYLSIIPHKEGLIGIQFMCNLDDPNYEVFNEKIYFYQSDIKIILSNFLQEGIKITTMDTSEMNTSEKIELFKD